VTQEKLPALSTHNLSVSIGDVCLVKNLTLNLQAGERLVILGRNGAGKTSLLHTLAGLRAAASGNVQWNGADSSAIDPRQAAQQRGLLPQHHTDAFQSTVLETALIGRHPHLGRWSWESAADERIARDALQEVGLSELAERDIQTLSGGERQRLAIATLLAQDPRIYLLDEPLAHLDLNHQIAMLKLMSARAKAGAAVVMVHHDVNLALRYSDRALLLFGDGSYSEGLVQDVVEVDALSRLYGYPLRVIREGERYYFVPD